MGFEGILAYSFRRSQAWERFDFEIESVPKMIRFRRDIRFKKIFAEKVGVFHGYPWVLRRWMFGILPKIWMVLRMRL